MNPAELRLLLRERAALFEQIRSFFRARKVLEVDTHLLGSHSVTDAYMKAFEIISKDGQTQGYLQTSPEYAMKRLLAQGCGDIYQLGKMFRAEESGRHHACEFTLLEWYRLGFGISQLMDEVHALVSSITGIVERQDFCYAELFIERLGFCPFEIPDDDLSAFARAKLGDIPVHLLRDNYLTMLFSELIEPTFAKDHLTFVYHYPESQAALAKVVRRGGHTVAERFEAYLGGVELANGFDELTDAKLQQQRFEQDNQIRSQLGLPQMEIDQRLIDALEQGLPDCSGVALGVDRLLMVKLDKPRLADVIPLSD